MFRIHRKTAFGAAFTVLALLLFWYLRGAAPSGVPESKTESAAPSVSIQTSGAGSYTIEELPVEKLNSRSSGTSTAPTPPALGRFLAVPSSFRSDVAAVIAKSIGTAVDAIRANPENTAAWLDLAIYRKMVDDYAGAETIWKFLDKRSPGNAIVLGNLAELERLYLKNDSLAETYYERGIAADPSDTRLYRGLYELYRYSTPPRTAAAEAILKKGIGANPSAIDLLTLLASYYRESGNAAASRTYYERALEALRAAGGNPRLEEELSRILETLQQ